MSNEIVKSQTFEEKMKARIKDSIGDLISDDDLSKMVNRGVEEVFFGPTKIKTDGWNSTTKDGPSLLHSIIKELLTEQVNKEVRKWIESHPEDVRKIEYMFQKRP